MAHVTGNRDSFSKHKDSFGVAEPRLVSRPTIETAASRAAPRDRAEFGLFLRQAYETCKRLISKACAESQNLPVLRLGGNREVVHFTGFLTPRRQAQLPSMLLKISPVINYAPRMILLGNPRTTAVTIWISHKLAFKWRFRIPCS